MHPYRVFVSYSHEDARLARKLVRMLEQRGLRPLWDTHVQPGTAFNEEIKSLITYAHLFLPLITENSQRRPWVHQETGYAMALNIPVLPVAVVTKPSETAMAAQYQAICVGPNLADLRKRLAVIDFDRVVALPSPAHPQLIEIADWPEARTDLMAKYADRVAELARAQLPRGFRGQQWVRQRAAISSFCIPDRRINDPIWDLREGDHTRSPRYRELQREERQAWERHARRSGCKLIIFPGPVADRMEPIPMRTRLSIFLEFLESMPPRKVRIVVVPHKLGGSLAILGDWFFAESLTPRPGEGYRQSTFVWHAPTVLRRVREFDEQFAELCVETGTDPDDSLPRAIAEVKRIIAAIDAKVGKRSRRGRRSE